MTRRNYKFDEKLCHNKTLIFVLQKWVIMNWMFNIRTDWQSLYCGLEATLSKNLSKAVTKNVNISKAFLNIYQEGTRKTRYKSTNKPDTCNDPILIIMMGPGLLTTINSCLLGAFYWSVCGNCKCCIFLCCKQYVLLNSL